jgi:hypothetical protein
LDCFDVEVNAVDIDLTEQPCVLAMGKSVLPFPIYIGQESHALPCTNPAGYFRITGLFTPLSYVFFCAV